MYMHANLPMCNLVQYIQLHSSSVNQDLETVLSKTKPVACMMILQEIHVPPFATKRMDTIKCKRIMFILMPPLQRELELESSLVHPSL